MASSNLSLRLPAELRAKLDEAARSSRRSRSQIVQMALERHMGTVVGDRESMSNKERVERIRALAGSGKPLKPRTGEEIDAHIRWLRGDD
jgi:RHH-type transcriptional regulator, rel operon repressor / antitoxin RelB